MSSQTVRVLFDLRPDTTIESEVVIIGGGIMGLSTAYFLAKRGKQVTVLERRTFGFEASSRNAGGVRQQGRDPREIPLAMASVALWATLADELGAPTHYRRGGNIVVALSDREMETLQRRVASERKLGLAVEMIDRKQLAELVPGISERCIGGSYCPTDGVAEPSAVVSAFVGAAERLGVNLCPHTEALDFVVENDRVVSVLTEKIAIRPRITVNMANAWAPLLAMRIGVVLPIRPVRSQLVEIDLGDTPFPQFLGFPEVQVCCRPTAYGRVHFGPLGSSVGRPDLEDPLPPGISYFSNLVGVLPRLENAQITRKWSGLLDVTPDAVPILGYVPGLRDYVVAAGFSGHGFCLGPIVGKLISELIIDQETSLSIDAFALARFGRPEKAIWATP